MLSSQFSEIVEFLHLTDRYRSITGKNYQFPHGWEQSKKYSDQEKQELRELTTRIESLRRQISG